MFETLMNVLGIVMLYAAAIAFVAAFVTGIARFVADIFKGMFGRTWPTSIFYGYSVLGSWVSGVAATIALICLALLILLVGPYYLTR